jgi:hypothetical protein
MRQRTAEKHPILPPPCDKFRQLFQLRHADRRLHICSFQVIAQMRVNIFVVIAHRKRPKPAGKTVSAGTVLSAAADAVPAPVPQRADDPVQQRIAGINRAPLSGGDVMGGIKAGSTKVSDGPRFAPDAAHPVLRAQGVAIVLNQPQAVFIAESSHHGQIKGTAQRMRQNDGPCPVRSGLFQEGHVHIAVRELYIHKHRLQAALDDGSNRGGEPGGNREDLIPPS